MATTDDILAIAARLAGLDAAGAAVIRDGSNVMYRLPASVVVWIGPEETQAGAVRQVEVARWLAASGLPVVRALDGVAQPTMVGSRPVTWWELLPEHRAATTGELGAVLGALHALAPPEWLELPRFDPLAGIEERIVAATHLAEEDRAWLAERADQLRGHLRRLPLDAAEGVIHGDAWQGNVAVAQGAPPVLLDFEHVCRGPWEWDLIPVAVDRVDFARLSAGDYRDFVAAYGGYDVTARPAFRVLADIQELRWVCFVLGKAAASDSAAHETRHRIACLRGDIARPWTWNAF
ncbi:phosphotransferase enzyme family protein [Salinactinospora qingdaonensis]|uniref:phosphotransferase enzyme family protein n=1 Tax=Salinactinospora qingdaonensis TaxID=702744 RepID=UPI0031F0DDFE